ncbi:MAG TPA: TauD/TfdA family dioxygenase [Burkholderiales bacterium]|nr:TauD/TfdA family dioxygenase [Burkholderiales bacterium]
MPQFAEVNYRELGIFGAEVLGVDLGKPLSESLTRGLAGLLLERQLLLFRNQTPSDRAFVDYARALGQLQPHSLPHFAPEGCPEILILSNRVQDGRPVGLVEVGHFWHSDGSYLPELDAWTTLQGIEIPRDNEGNPLGDTLFASAVCAYDALPADLRQKVEGLKAVFSYDYRYQQRIKRNPTVQPARANSTTKDILHPVIRPHPITGRKAIFVNEGYTTRVDGLPESEGRTVLASLLQHLYSEQFVYRHKWRTGDVLLWDNNSTQHNAVPNYGSGQHRLMKRITIKTVHPALARPPESLQCA